ncbi:MAG TPA: sigma-70 family RNA polymerase sigma factor [Polyangia bacterium]
MGTVSRPDFASLTLPHMAALYRTACRLTARASEAEDLVQETYLEGFRCYPSLRDPGSSRAWMFRILHNLWSERRTKEAARALSAKLQASEATDWSAVVIPREEDAGFSDELTHALASLPEEFRTAVLLVTVEELSYGEVAEVMNCPIGTVRSRVARGRALLAGALAAHRAEVFAKE